MDNHRDPAAVDPDRSEGSAKKLGGDIKEGIGKVLGDEKLKREGQADQVEGKAQNALGGLKDAAREAIGTKPR